MPSSKVDIANRALQKIGVPRRISSMTEGSNEASTINGCFNSLRDAELRANDWAFAIKRVQLPAHVDTPVFGRDYQYQLPTDFLRKLPEDPTAIPGRSDDIIEGTKLLTDEGAPFNLRYVGWDVAPETFDALFVEALAARIAMETCEALTNSTTRKESCKNDYAVAISQARLTNAILSQPVEPEEDEWISVRR